MKEAMAMRFKKIMVFSFCFLLILGTGFGCKASSKKTEEKAIGKMGPKDLEKELKKSAEKYWDLVADNNHTAIYNMLSPENKKLIGKSDYIRRQKVLDKNVFYTIYGAKANTATVDEKKGTVTVTVATDRGDVPGSTSFILVKGKWYREMTQQNKNALMVGKSYKKFLKAHQSK